MLGAYSALTSVFGADACGGGGGLIAPRADAAAFGRRGLGGTPGAGAGAACGAWKTGEETGWEQADISVASPESPESGIKCGVSRIVKAAEQSEVTLGCFDPEEP